MRPFVLLATLLLAAGCAEPEAAPSATSTPSLTAPASPAPSPSPAPPAPPLASPTPTPSPPPSPPPDAPVPGENEVFMTSFRFEPAEVTVATGAAVRWVNFDAAPHTVTGDAGGFDSGVIGEAGIFEASFDAPGTYRYHCELHEGMSGTLVVVGDPMTPPTPTPTASPSPSPTPTPTPSPTPSPPPTPTPTPSPSPTPTPSPTPPEPVTIDIQGFAFVGGTRTVPVGTSVTWRNLDGAPHTASATDGSFDSGTLTQGQTFTRAFQAAGSFPYKCALHPSMTATLTVA